MNPCKNVQNSNTKAAEVNDVVLMTDDKPRNQWDMARVSKIFQNEMGAIKTVEIELANKTEVVRPMNKIVG